MKKRFVQSVQRHARTIGYISGITGAVTAYGFLVLVTCMGFHWWLPLWSAETGRVMFITLIILCIPYILLYALHLWLKAKAYKKHGYDYSIIQTLIVLTETFTGFILCAVWGLLVLANQPSSLPLKLLAGVWVMGFVGLIVLQVYELRRQRRQSLS